MVSLLRLRRGGESPELPREITRTILPTSGSGLGETGWLMRFFDSAFFCEWIAVSYLYKHDHPGVRDYLCNRMYTLPLSGIESYLFQICYMLVYKPSPSLDRFVIDICSKSLQISLKVHWFLMAEIEDSDDSNDYSNGNDEQRIRRVQEECQMAATLMGEWSPLIRPSSRIDSFSPLGKNQVFNRLFSSKQKSSPPALELSNHRSFSFSPPSPGNTLTQDGKIPTTPEENKIFKKLIPSPRVRGALLFRKSGEKDEEGSEKDGFFKRFLRDSKDEDSKKSGDRDKDEDSKKSGDRDNEEREKDGFFKKLLSSSTKDEDSRNDKDDKESDKDGFFKKLLSISRDEDGRKAVDKDDDGSEKEGVFKKILKDSRDEDGEVTSSSDGIFKRIFGDDITRNDSGDKRTSKSMEADERDGIFRKFFKEKVEEKKDGSDEKDDVKAMKLSEDDEKEGFFKKLFKEKVVEKKDGSGGNDDIEKDTKLSKDDEKDGFFRKFFKEKVEEKKDGSDGNNDVEKTMKLTEDDEKEGFFKKLFKEKVEEKKDGRDGNDDVGKAMKLSEDDEKEGFFKKFFKEKFEDKKDGSERDNEDGKVQENGEDEELFEFSLLSRLFRFPPDDSKAAGANENNNNSNLIDSSPGTENFFRKLFMDRDRAVEDSELFGSKKKDEKHPGSPKQQNEKSNAKPPLPNSSASQFRKGTYFASLEFVQSLCETSYELVDVFPIGDRKSVLCESLAEINAHVAAALTSGGVCFPMGKGMYRVVNIPEDEAILLNSREKAPYMICVEVLKSETSSISKDASNMHKLSKGGIPLANGDALLPKPPPWAYPLRAGQDMYLTGYDRMSVSASQAIDQAMAQLWENNVKFVHANFSVEKQSHSDNQNCTPQRPSLYCDECRGLATCTSESDDGCNGDWVRVVLTADPGVSMDDIVDQELSRRKEHRRVPSTVAYEEVKAAALKGEAPTGLPLKGAGQDSSDAQLEVGNGGVPKATDALSGELWEVKKERIRKASVCGKLPGWDLQSVIVKSGDDCRQEHLAVQLISHFYDIFQEAGLPLWLRPYEVLVTSSYTALIETIPDTASIHSIKSRHPNVTSLRNFFVAKYQENSPSFKLAQRNFVESMAGYSLVCYLLQFKDRHNGNLLLDEEGHIIHIDFGFMLSNSPGGVNFESAPFKLTRELLEVMDSDAEGVPSEYFDYFKVLCIQGFLTCRKHAERIILLVEMVQDSGFPCFNGGPRTIQNLRERFHLSLTEEQCVSLVLSLISSSLDAWRTRQYDYYQRVLNGIL